MSSQVISFSCSLVLPYFSCSLVSHEFSPVAIFGYSFDTENIRERLPTYSLNPLWLFDGEILSDLDGMTLSQMDYTIIP